MIGNLTIHSSVGRCYSQVTSNLNRSQQLEWYKQRYDRKVIASFLCRPVLLSANVQSKQVAAAGSVQKNVIIAKLTHYSSVGQCYSQVMSNLNRSQQLEGFKQRYNRKANALFLCRPVLLSGNVQSEQVAAAGRLQTTI